MRPRCFCLGLVLLGTALVAGPAAASDWYERGHGRAPVGARVYICHGYTCRIITPVEFTGGDLARLTAPLQDAPDPAAERAALSQAVQVYEQIVGPRVGTGADLPGMQFGQGKDDQMDCIDEATNTTSLLRVLQEQGSLKFHRVLDPAGRGFFLDGRYPHATAVIAEEAGGMKWAIDSWPNANGEPPVVQPLSVWYRSRSGAGNS